MLECVSCGETMRWVYAASTRIAYNHYHRIYKYAILVTRERLTVILALSSTGVDSLQTVGIDSLTTMDVSIEIGTTGPRKACNHYHHI